MESRATTLRLHPVRVAHPAAPPVMSLDGMWLMAEGGGEDSRLGTPWTDAIPARIPGSVHAALVAAGRLPDPTIGRNQILVAQASYKTWWFQTTFPRLESLKGERLVFDGVCNRCTVWLNGKQLGCHEGMFGGPSYEVADLLAEENSLVVRLDPIPREINEGEIANRSWSKTVVFNNVYGWHYSQCPSLGLWRSVRVEGTPDVRLLDPFVATKDLVKGLVDLSVTLDAGRGTLHGRLLGSIAPDNFEGVPQQFSLEVGLAESRSTLHLRFKVKDHRVWWPLDLGEPNLYRMTLAFVPDGGTRPDSKTFTFGIRTITMAPLPGGPTPDKYNWTFVVNGKPMFIKGAGWCTMDPLMDFSRERYDRFLSLARDQHCQMLRCWGCGMPETEDFYDLCDRYGIMVMQEWPTAFNSHLKQPYALLEETVRLNMLRLRNRVSLVLWCGANESMNPFGAAMDMMGRLSVELDGTRPFHRSEHWGGSTHHYDSYWCRWPLDEHLRKEAIFFGEYGMPSVPDYESVQRYLPADEKTVWPPPDDGSFAFHTPIFNRSQCLDRIRQFAKTFIPKDHGMEQFIIGSQLAQVVCLRHQFERARTRWPACTGTLYYKMNDNFPAASWATVDWYGAPKIAHYVMKNALAPLHACLTFNTIHSMGMELNPPVYLLDDADRLKGTRWQMRISAYDGNLDEIRTQLFEGSDSIVSPLKLGWFMLRHEQTETAPLFHVAEVLCDGQLVDRTYYWINYEFDRGCLFRLPSTTLAMRLSGLTVCVTNTGALPAVGVHVDRPGHLDTFTASDNYFWLNPGESKDITVNSAEGLVVSAWNAGAHAREPVPA
jgi:beta-mannosidase